MTLITQLFAKTLTFDDAEVFLSAKPDHVGWIVNLQKPDLDKAIETSSTISERLRQAGIRSVVLVHPSVDAQAISRVLIPIRPDIFLASSERSYEAIKQATSLPGAPELMVPIGIPVSGYVLEGYDPNEEIRRYSSIAHWFITDTICSSDLSTRFGCSGNRSDVNVMRQVVHGSHVPVIVAGGITPENVAEIYALCHPTGFDAHTAVCTGGVPDNVKSRAFVNAVHALEICD